MLLDGTWQRMHWWIATMAVLYALSGITIIRPDEVAVILRWGHLVGDTPALQEHGSGLLFAFPRPIDRVVRVQVKHVWETRIETLNSLDTNASMYERTLDPLTQGYALTGDQNIVHVEMVARYRVRDPAEWAFYSPNPDNILRVEVSAAMVRSLGEMRVDRVLADGRKSLIETVTSRAQAGLDAAHSGLELSSLELTRLAPPRALVPEFDAVQSAFIRAQTQTNEANAFVQSAIPEAHAQTDAAIQDEQGKADSVLSIAKGESDAFLALEHEYRENPSVVRERLYRDALDRAIAAAGQVRWIPPPVGGNYHGFRLTLSSEGVMKSPTDNESDSINESVPTSDYGAPPPGEEGATTHE
jgi:membrane protease subunit HflK